MDHAQGWVPTLGSLVLTHGLIGPAIRGTDGFGLSPGAVEVALRITVAYEKLHQEKKMKWHRGYFCKKNREKPMAYSIGLSLVSKFQINLVIKS